MLTCKNGYFSIYKHYDEDKIFTQFYREFAEQLITKYQLGSSSATDF